jgi:hypothetical protein
VAEEVRQKVIAVEKRHVLRGGAPLDVAAANAELATIWKSPCVAHLARFFRAPAATHPHELEVVLGGMTTTLRAEIGATYVRDGVRSFVVPSLPRPQLEADARARLQPWLCADGDARCGGRAASYITRAEASFDREESERELMRSSRLATDECKGVGEAVGGSGPTKPTPFEAWATCAIGAAPWTHRYAPLRYRAPERGWLVLRGRRGHYVFADEIRAYDLATGAAYVARSESELVLGESVDFAAVDAKRKPEAITGTVVAEQVRELAFALVTQPAVSSARTKPRIEPIPEKIGLTLTPVEAQASVPLEVGPPSWWSSAQTSIAFALVVDGKTLARGDFMWPHSARATDRHAIALVDVLEAGLERGCAPARLPGGLGTGPIGGTSELDADPARQDATYRQLATALEGLRAKACPGVR